MSVDAGFRHEALLYAGPDEFVSEAGRFIADAIDADEPVLVAVSPEKIGLLTQHLDGRADRVHFVDMFELGRNPARIIPEWQRFLDRHDPARPLRGIGEPVWPGRDDAEVAECHRHEWLLNQVVPADRPLWLLCPYDTAALDASIVEDAERTHPHIAERGGSRSSVAFAADDPSPGNEPLPEPALSLELAFEGDLGRVRSFVHRWAIEAGLSEGRTDDLVLAASELAANSIRHGGGSGLLRVWVDGDRVACEVADSGFIDDPLAGRRIPSTDARDGRGLWLVNHLCDLVQIRSTPTGSVVRAYLDRSPDQDG